MIRFVECSRAGHNENDLMFEAVADDGTKYQFRMTTECFKRLFVMGWKAAQNLPAAPSSGESVGLESKASFAIVNMQPGLALTSGPLVLLLGLSKKDVATLQNEMEKFSTEIKRSPKH
jgi:hypothetical protein